LASVSYNFRLGYRLIMRMIDPQTMLSHRGIIAPLEKGVKLAPKTKG
jgi:hypothetical protein